MVEQWLDHYLFIPFSPKTAAEQKKIGKGSHLRVFAAGKFSFVPTHP